MEQKEIQQKTILLNRKGRLNAAGYAKTMQFSYNRDKARRFPFKLKEWNFYQFIKGDNVVQLTIGHVSYTCSVTATLLNIKNGVKHQISKMRWFFMPGLDLNPEEESVNEFTSKNFVMTFKVANKKRVLSFKGTNKKYKNVDILIVIENDISNEKMVIATPFKKKAQFYLNYKENYYRTKGHAIFDDIKIDLEGATGLLDWGRGIWPYKHEWFWGSASSFIDGIPFGLNIGWGFGDLTNATENMFFYNKKAYKLGVLKVERNLSGYLAPWHIKDEEGTIELLFEPIFDNYTENKFVIIDTHCDQVYGYFNGFIKTSDGLKKVKNILGFIEHAVNRW
jgi:hypothetical protein